LRFVVSSRRLWSDFTRVIVSVRSWPHVQGARGI
jgi:hypothetical protein